MIPIKKREPEAYSKKKYTQITILGIGLGVLGAASLGVGAVLQDLGRPAAVYLPFCIAFFPLMIIAVIFMIHHHPGMVMYELEKKWNQLQEGGCQRMEAPKWLIEDFCKAEKFQYLPEGYYHRRKFNLQRDYVNFYIRTCPMEDVRSSIEQEMNRFDGYEFKGKNKCLILFAEKSGVTEDDKQALVDFANIFISIESVAPGVIDAAFVVLRDNQTGQAWCVNPGKNKLTLYHTGYKLAMKILND